MEESDVKKIISSVSAAAMLTTLIAPQAVSFAAAKTFTVGSGKDYASIREAVAAAKAANPQSESDRITINVDPGDYEEQVVLDNMHYVTLQQTPGTSGRVDLHWYYCTGYCAANCGLDGNYDPNLDWYANPPKGADGTVYKLGEAIPRNTVLTYTKKDGTTETKTLTRDNYYLGTTGGLSQMAALQVRNKSTDLTIKDFNIVNSVPVMVTQGEKDAHITPEHDRAIDVTTSYPLMYRDGLSLCDENTALTKPSGDYYTDKGIVDGTKVYNYVKNGGTFTAEESAWLVQSLAYNERGHAVSTTDCDRIIFEGIRLRGNQDSLFASGDRLYFKDCDIIGGTDYIYGNAAAVFDNCLLGLAGSTDRVYGSPIAVPNTDAKRSYGYLFYNCTAYNTRDNNGTHNLGGPWGSAGQVTYFNLTIDDAAKVGKSAFVLDPLGWHRFSAEQGFGRLYEFGTKNSSGAAVDLSKRVVNKSKEEGGYGMGTVLDKWQILEFNPANYFSAANAGKSDDWDPMNFKSTYLAQVNSEIAASTINVPAGEETQVALPSPSDSNIEFHWVSQSTNAVVSDDEKSITVVRPAAGEDAIETSVILYARDKNTGFGDMKEIPVTINATTDTTNVFSIPVTIDQSLAAKNKYTVTISKNGALIKQQEISLKAGETSASATIENVPASASGIDYDVTIVSESNDFTITDPEDGKTTIKGITGNNVPLALTATRLIDKEITLDETTTAAAGNKTYDLIALAKAQGATDEITSSDVISVSFDVKLDSKPSKVGYIDISSAEPKGNNSATAGRFTEFKINSSWNQIDSVDCTQGFSGSSNGDHQCLNITGQFGDYTATHTVTATIDYKNGTVTIDGSESGNRKTATPWTFAAFPENVEKGSLNMGVFPGSTADSYTVSNIKVTYKKVATAEDLQEEEPEVDPVDVLEYPFDNTHVTNGNQCNNTSTLLFTNGANADAKALFADPSDNTKLRADLVAHYKNYICGTATNGTHPQIKVTAPAGNYKLYYLGYNNESAFTATMKDVTYTAGAGEQFAYKSDNETYVLKLYTMDITLDKAVVNETMTFDAPISWLPDTYAVIIKSVADTSTKDKKYDFLPTNNEYINTTNSSSTDPRGSLDGNDYDLEGNGSVVISKDNYHSGTGHGLVIWGGENKIKIRTEGPMEVIVGGCTYSNATTVTLKADGTAVDTQDYAKADGEFNTLRYNGTEPAELTVVFDGYVYLHSLEIKNVEASAEPTAEPTAAPTPTPEPQFAYAEDKVYNLAPKDNEYINSTNSSASDPRGSVDGGEYYLNGDKSVVFSNDCYQSGTSHGVVVWGGDNKIKIQAQGPMDVIVGGCTYSAANNVTLKADGTEVDTQEYAKQDGNTNVLHYTGTEPAELTVVFDGYVYLHSLEVKNVTPAKVEVSEGEVFDSHEDSAKAVAFTAEITPGTNTISSLVWKATDKASGKSAEKNAVVPQLTSGTVTYGLVVILEDSNIAPENVTAQLTAE